METLSGSQRRRRQRGKNEMTTTSLNVYHGEERLLSDDRRVILRYLAFGHPPRVRSIFRRLMKLSETQVAALLEETLASFAGRHHAVEPVFVEHYKRVARECSPPADISLQRRLLIGACFTLEYSFEAAALFNPSMVLHPNQGDLREGHVRFLLSLRATGEGHISSIVFRCGELDERGRVTLSPCPRHARTTRPDPDRPHDRSRYEDRVRNLGVDDRLVRAIVAGLPETFAAKQLRQAIKQARQNVAATSNGDLTRTLMLPALANYSLQFPPDSRPSELVIFPASEIEWHGMEDLRLVRFVGDDASVHYYGTYTAYDGRRVYPMIIDTPDFRHFRVNTVSGPFAKDKGWAMFPRRIDGRYAMLSRHDGESLFIMTSDDLYHWVDAQPLLKPKYPWELVQIGNSGSPIETPRGWILLTHGVGPMRQYAIGAALLDLQDPSRVLGRLRHPLLAPTEEDREGHVPNVVYSCGAMLHRGQLVIPYAMSDSRTGFAAVNAEQLVDQMLADGP